MERCLYSVPKTAVKVTLFLVMALFVGEVLLWGSPLRDNGGTSEAAKASSQGMPKLEAKVIPLKPSIGDHLLISPPQTVRTRSGYVLLEPGKSVGRHSTGNNEEILIVFEGSGNFAAEGGPTLKMSANTVVYCPPNTFHNVTNTGTGTLRYVYVVGKAQ